MSLEIDRLAFDDVNAALTLSTQAGWNQTRADWLRLLELFPGTCFAGRVDGELVATSTLAAYETAGWIGMVLVDEDHRRRGYGSEIFARALRAGLDHELDVVGLDATDAGRTVYEQHGFETVGGIDRWSGTLQPPSDETGQPSPDGAGQPSADGAGDGRIVSIHGSNLVDGVVKFDRRHSGVDRRPLLEHLLGSVTTTGIALEVDGAINGYAVVRPGRTKPHVGPVVAAGSRNAEMLLAAAADRVDGPVIVDAVRDEPTTTMLNRFGLAVQRRLYRMTHDEVRQILDGEGVLAAAGFEWG